MVLLKHQQIVFEDRYKHDMDDGIEGMWDRVAKAASSVEKNPSLWYPKFFNLLKDFKFCPGGRILSTAGTGNTHPLFNCYVIESPEDSRKGILANIEKMVEIMAHGGGVGVDLSTLRYKNAPVLGVNGKSSGVVAWANLYSEATGTIQQGGSRRGALLLSLRCDHPDIIDFIKAKQNLNVLTNANLSVLITDDFMKAVQQDNIWNLRWKGRIVNNIKARTLWNEICECAWRTGEPGIIFIDTYNKLNNTWYFEQIVTTNPCGELGLPADGVCNLGSLNLSAFVEDNAIFSEEFTDAIKLAVRFLDNMIDVSTYLYPQNEKVVKRSRRIGLGTMGLADMLLKMGGKYGSEHSLELIDDVYKTIRDCAYMASIDLAVEKGKFPLYEDRYLEGKYVSNLPDDIREAIKKHGIRNATILTLPPTGSTGLLANTSSGIEPIFAWKTKRKDRLGEYEIRHWILDEFNDNLPDYAVTADQVSPVEHIKVQAVIQKYVDSSISKTINMPNNSTVQDVMDAYMLAYTLGCKGCTVYRDGCRDDQVLTKAEVKPSIVTANTKDLDRGVWKKKAPDTKYYPVKVYIGCGKLKLLIGWSDIEQSIQDMYVIRTGSGGCECNLQGMVISMSGMLRLGGDIFNIEKAFTGMSTCNSFTAKRAKGQGKLSPGSNCGTAILLALKEFISRVKTDEVSVAATSEYVKDATTCPICGKYLVRSGCWKCPNCGFEKCE